jgi:hypothetical protein
MRLKKTAALVVVALALPAAAAATPGNGGGHGHGQGPAKGVSYVFKGTYGVDGVVNVTSGNAHARKAGLVDGDVGFDLSAAKLKVGDTNADGIVDITDVILGDSVIVKAKLPKSDPGTAPFPARELLDKTHPAE